ncbi:[protein-PII] uridylyltransferase [Candidatus Albibeggiatoa sp. nov. NOAA]|uniref:[protein-PII] uridylyltransferase n=1 Tax=Candidatus Albibeggiatoa sp. nov. NOAA TaxID=3162724 RepID=UPI0032F500AE|nr:[protein-PII] uridylyltransferase [Thiotrichaceae bacterium]
MSVNTYSDPQVFNPDDFNQMLSSGEPEIKVFRQALEQGHEVLKQRFLETKNASGYVFHRSWLIDQVLQQALSHICIWIADEIALIAVGGYGRGELHPSSDIDILIILAQEPNDDMRECLERFITFLWDIKLEVGHSVRTLAECEQEARDDITVATNLMEARLLMGGESLFHKMQQLVGPRSMWSSRDFFAEKCNEQAKRYAKYHDTSYNLEPNIKEGPGGLRDIQTVAWVAKRHLGASTLHDLVQQGFITDGEYQSLIEGQEFLWQIRCFLHFHSKRREDRLLFDFQRTLAEDFDYLDKEGKLAVEQFMKKYYRTVMSLNTLNDLLLQVFQEHILYDDSNDKVIAVNKRFQIRKGFIEVTHDRVFVNYPFALLEVFLLMQQHPEVKGVRAHTLRLIYQHVYLIDDAFHRDLRARSLFYEILHQPSGITRALRLMNRYGVLGAYIPNFGRIVGQMQYDLFHVYTVDQHTLFVVRNLRRFCVKEYQHEFPLCTEIVHTLPKLELMYLAGLFHDIAKGRGGDHSELGEKDALTFCHEHGFSDHDARLVSWLVRNHLMMSTTAQREDTSDPSVINNFAQRVQDKMHLDYLYVLTVADIRATSPKLWNGWKNTLLADLYHKTLHVLEYGSDQTLDKQYQVQDIQANARDLLAGSDLSDEKIQFLWSQLGDEYFLRSTPQAIASETQTIIQHQSSDKSLVLERHDPHGGTELVLFMRDRDYLFAETTQYLERKAITIVDAYVIPTDSEHSLGGYTILDSDKRTVIQDSERMDEIKQGLEEVLNRDVNEPFCPITHHMSRQLKHFPVPTRISFTQDSANNHTIMEVITTDRPGVLSRIAQAFLHCEVILKKAKIGTFGSRVEDIFFVTDKNNNMLFSADQLDCLREYLSELLDEDIPKPEEK